MKHRDVVLVSVIPHTVLRKSNVNLLQYKLNKNKKQSETDETSENVLKCDIGLIEVLISYSVLIWFKHFLRFITQGTWILSKTKKKRKKVIILHLIFVAEIRHCNRGIITL